MNTFISDSTVYGLKVGTLYSSHESSFLKWTGFKKLAFSLTFLTLKPLAQRRIHQIRTSTHLLMRVFLQIFCLPILVRSVEVVVGIDVDVVIEEVSGKLCCGKIFDITGKLGVEN